MIRQRFARVWLFVVLGLVGVFAGSCTCTESSPAPKARRILACKPHSTVAITPPLAAKEIVPGGIPVSFSAGDDGIARLSIPITVSSGRNNERIQYANTFPRLM